VSSSTLKVLHIKYQTIVTFYGNNTVLVVSVTCLVTQKRRNLKTAKACAVRVCIVFKLYAFWMMALTTPAAPHAHTPRQQPLHNLSLLTWLKRGKCELISHRVIMNFPSVRILNSTPPPPLPTINFQHFLTAVPLFKVCSVYVMFMLQYITEHLKQNCDKLCCKLIACFNGLLLRCRAVLQSSYQEEQDGGRPGF
jgi:hypothetical protein